MVGQTLQNRVVQPVAVMAEKPDRVARMRRIPITRIDHFFVLSRLEHCLLHVLAQKRFHLPVELAPKRVALLPVRRVCCAPGILERHQLATLVPVLLALGFIAQNVYGGIELLLLLLKRIVDWPNYLPLI